MNISKRTKRLGTGAVAAIVLVTVAASLSMAYLQYSTADARAMERALDYQRAKVVADAGLDSALAKIKTIIPQYRFVLTKAEMQTLLNSQISRPAAIGGYDYKTPGGSWAWKIDVVNEPTYGTIPAGSLVGSVGRYQSYQVVCGAVNGATKVGAVLRQTIQASSAFLLRFGVFYDADLEVLPGPTMVFAGPVHSNTDLYVGGPLEFNSRLSAVGDIFHHRKNDGTLYGNARVRNTAGSLVSFLQNVNGQQVVVDSDNPDWAINAIDLWDGRVRSGAHGVSSIAPPIADQDVPHDIIERQLPTSHPSYNSATEAEKFHKKAALYVRLQANGTLIVTDSKGQNLTSRFTQATLQTDGTYNGYTNYKKNSSFDYNITNSGSWGKSAAYQVIDQRENKYLSTLDIYVDKFLAAYPELYSGTDYTVAQGRGLVYLTVDPQTSASNHLPVVRLRNARDLKATAGISFASDRPMYIEGNYNTVSRKPALIAADAITFLSETWQDSHSHFAKSTRQAGSTEYNAVIMTGNSETTPYVQYNGGLENVLRFLEYWGSSVTATFRGSIIDLWYAESATGAWNGNYYEPPRRDWAYDSIYDTQAPPGMTEGFAYDEVAWKEMNWSNAGL
ncbi:MAG: hypothetical protein U1F77_17595 [Kiritimatiellia bacterium]